MSHVHNFRTFTSSSVTNTCMNVFVSSSEGYIYIFNFAASTFFNSLTQRRRDYRVTQIIQSAACLQKSRPDYWIRGMEFIMPLCVHSVCLILVVQVYRHEQRALPVGVDDLAESELTAHLQVALVLGQVAGGTLWWIHFAVFIRFVQCFDKLAWHTHTQQV